MGSRFVEHRRIKSLFRERHGYSAFVPALFALVTTKFCPSLPIIARIAHSTLIRRLMLLDALANADHIENVPLAESLPRTLSASRSGLIVKPPCPAAILFRILSRGLLVRSKRPAISQTFPISGLPIRFRAHTLHLAQLSL